MRDAATTPDDGTFEQTSALMGGPLPTAGGEGGASTAPATGNSPAARRLA